MTSTASRADGDEAQDAGDLAANSGDGGDGGITLPRLGPRGWARWAWRQLTSMRTALMLLVLLAVAAVPGSVLAAAARRPGRGRRLPQCPHHGPGPGWTGSGVFDVYTSPWFSAIYLLLFISLIGCVLPRSRVHLAALRSQPPATPGRLDRLPAHVRAVLPSGGRGGGRPGRGAGRRAGARGRRGRAARPPVQGGAPQRRPGAWPQRRRRDRLPRRDRQPGLPPRAGRTAGHPGVGLAGHLLRTGHGHRGTHLRQRGHLLRLLQQPARWWTSGPCPRSPPAWTPWTSSYETTRHRRPARRPAPVRGAP